MDLSTRYLGLTLRSPLVPSASPFSRDLDLIMRLEDAGAAAIVFHSLFEEQLRADTLDQQNGLDSHTESFFEAQSFFPVPSAFHVGPELYLERIRAARERCGMPVIGSLNGSSLGGWTDFAALIQEAGADALELNVYAVASDPDRRAAEVEDEVVAIVAAVRQQVQIPLAVKLSPFYSNLSHLARRLVAAGANGLVLFNRFYQPDIDLESLEVHPRMALSQPYELGLPLRWIAILHGQLSVSLAATSGIDSAEAVIKALLVGADATMMCSALLRQGIGYLSVVEERLIEWLEVHEYESVAQLKGSMSQPKSPDPGAFERAHYTRALQSWH